eukprot:snap_masked-scaffold_42-processed-gene-1.35-mRNA-1 protein AED:1.00 eAED:1.00 QI:0/-1/0/0/-1/1/1/0/59
MWPSEKERKVIAKGKLENKSHFHDCLRVGNNRKVRANQETQNNSKLVTKERTTSKIFTK